MTPAVPAAMRVRRMGERALLVELPDLEQVLGFTAALHRDPVPGQLDVVPAARTVLVRLGHDASLDAAADHLGRLKSDDADVHDAVRHVLPVQYGGADLAEVAALLGMSEEAFVRLHSSSPWTVAFTGFAPGFAYLVAPDLGLRVPRRPSPRTSVPAGSVALADEFSGVYPRDSPGGWQLVGRTDAVLWDVRRERPALLAPGDTVVFRPVREVSVAVRPAADAPLTAPPGITVLDPGFSSTVQDRGRPGWAALGVSPSGAADPDSYDSANVAVGNRRGAAALEITLGGLRVRAERELVVAVAGAAVPVHTVAPDGLRRGRARGRPFALRRGHILEVGAPEAGLRSYVAFRGGLDVPAELGSRSTDTLSGLGPAPLRAGDLLPVAGEVAGAVAADAALPPPTQVGAAVLRYTPGPREDWFTDEARVLLEKQTWRVGSRSDRVGLRLEGPRALQRSRSDELASEGMVAGALQVPPDGLPVLFLVDHPVTGGYPVIGVVIAEDLGAAGQLPPGSAVTFSRQDP